MKIGVYLGWGLPEAQAGGGFSFQHGLLTELLKTTSEHDYYIFCNDHSWKSENSQVKFVRLTNYIPAKNANIFKRIIFKICRHFEKWHVQKKYKSYLNRAALRYNIELMWFMTPAYQLVDVPYFYTVWDLQHRYQPYFPEVSVTGSTYEQREAHYKAIISKAAYVITGNNCGKQDVAKFYSVPDFRIKTIPMPTTQFALNNYAVAKNIVEKFGISKPFIFYPAQFWPHKNHITILLAIKNLKEQHKLNFDVIFTGSDKGNLNYIKEKTVELGLQQNVQFPGFVSIDELIQLYKNAFALVFSSYFGPDNIPPLEAFGLGCPVISSNFSGAKEQMQDAALYFEPGDEFELAAKIKKLYDNPELRDELTAKGRKIAEQCSCENYLKQVNALIDEFGKIRRCWSSKEPYVHI